MNSAVETHSEKELADFRAQLNAWLVDNKPADPGFLLPQTFMEVGSDQQLEFLREWQHKLWSAGYLGMAWPKEYGGQGVAPIFQMIADSEMRKVGVPIVFYYFILPRLGQDLLDGDFRGC